MAKRITVDSYMTWQQQFVYAVRHDRHAIVLTEREALALLDDLKTELARSQQADSGCDCGSCHDHNADPAY